MTFRMKAVGEEKVVYCEHTNKDFPKFSECKLASKAHLALKFAENSLHHVEFAKALSRLIALCGGQEDPRSDDD